MDAVEIPLKRMKKSMNARKKPFLSPGVAKGRTSWTLVRRIHLLDCTRKRIGCKFREELLAGVTLLMPDPGGTEDVVELGVARLPAEIVDRFA